MVRTGSGVLSVFASILAGFLLFVHPLTAQEAVQITWNFENGSLGSWKSANKNEILLTHAPGSGELWYYFQLDRIEGKTLTFIFENARKDFYDDYCLPVISYDQVHWFYIQDRTIKPHPTDPNRVWYSFTNTFAKNRAWIAYSPPYSNTQLNQELAKIEKRPFVKLASICDTPIHQQKLPLLIISDDTADSTKKTILLFSREDSYETAGTWLCLGAIHFLLSDDPLSAAIRRRCTFLIVPLFDRDGVTGGQVIHPLPFENKSVFWTETWPERIYSFYEQRQMKKFLQDWKDQGKTIDLAFRFHSDTWKSNFILPEHGPAESAGEQEKLFSALLGKKYLPWFETGQRTEMDTRLSKFIHDLFPGSFNGLIQSEFIYSNVIPGYPSFYKTTEDCYIEGELLIRALGEYWGIQGGNPPPFLHNTIIQGGAVHENDPIPVQCIYRDLMNRPPVSVQAVVNNKSFDLKKADESAQDYTKGVLYYGFITAKEGDNSCYFKAANSASSIQIPRQGAFPAPFILKKK